MHAKGRSQWDGWFNLRDGKSDSKMESLNGLFRSPAITTQKGESNCLVGSSSDSTLEIEHFLMTGLTDVQVHICLERLTGRTDEEIGSQYADLHYKDGVSEMLRLTDPRRPMPL
jgi:hypothetical protein